MTANKRMCEKMPILLQRMNGREVKIILHFTVIKIGFIELRIIMNHCHEYVYIYALKYISIIR